MSSFLLYKDSLLFSNKYIHNKYMALKSSSVLWFSDVDKDDIRVVGGKGANLGEMVRAKFPVPDGFILSSYAYFQFLRQNNLTPKINALLSTVHFERADSLIQVSIHIKNLIMRASISDELIKEIFDAYEQLGGLFKNAYVAVRSSATTEDLSTASFAGQQDTFLNVHGEANLLLKIRETWASLFEPRLIFYRHEQRFDHFRVGTAVIVQKMIASEKSGVMFTLDPVTNDKSKIMIEAIYGLGEMISQGEVTPDHYEVNKSDLSVTTKVLAQQEKMLKKVGSINKETKVPGRDAKKQKITDNQILDLALLGKKLEQHYYFPQDIEWAIEKNTIYILQTRAITTTHLTKSPAKNSSLSDKLHFVLKGAPAAPGIASGPVKIIHNAKDIGKILPGDVLVVPQTNPDFVSAMKKACALITDNGGRTCHAAIICRELGIPIVVGTGKATKVLQPGHVVTVNGTTGEVYKGAQVATANTEETTNTSHLKTATKIYLHLSDLVQIEQRANEPTDGVGLLEAECIIKELGIHPRKLLKEGDKHKFTDLLTKQIELAGRHFQTRPVIYRASDIYANDYYALSGGNDFEEKEDNPILGVRGVFRLIHDADLFHLELAAIKKAREKKGLTNVWLTIPFVRTVKELTEIKRIITAAGLHRSPTFKLWMTVETPANVILLDKFIETGIDGVLIGADMLTTLTLGVDKNNSHVAKEFDEMNPAILWALEQTIKTTHKHKISSSFFGNALTLHPSLLEKLIAWGITSVTIYPNEADTLRKQIHEAERKLIESHFHKKHT